MKYLVETIEITAVKAAHETKSGEPEVEYSKVTRIFTSKEQSDIFFGGINHTVRFLDQRDVDDDYTVDI